MESAPPVSAIFNTSHDVVEILRHALEPAGIAAVSVLTYQVRDGEVNVEQFLRQHEPDVIVYDIAPPYDANWRLFQHMRRMPAMKGRPIVLTSTNVAQVQKLAGSDTEIYEIVGKPYDLDQIVRAVKEALRSRPTR